MEDEKHRAKGTLIFNDDESYEAYKSGKGIFNNGLRRDNGTLYRQPDFEEYEEDNNEYSFDYAQDETSDNLLTKLLIAGGIFAVGYGTAKVAPKIRKWWKISAAPKIKRTWNKIFNKNLDNTYLSQRLDKVCEDYKKNITNEEAQEKLLEIFILSARLSMKIKELSNANIIDEKILIDKITSKKYIDCVNEVLSTNPNLLKENQKVLSDIVGREISQEGIYLPIESKKLFDQLNQIE